MKKANLLLFSAGLFLVGVGGLSTVAFAHETYNYTAGQTINLQSGHGTCSGNVCVDKADFNNQSVHYVCTAKGGGPGLWMVSAGETYRCIDCTQWQGWTKESGYKRCMINGNYVCLSGNLYLNTPGTGITIEQNGSQPLGSCSGKVSAHNCASCYENPQTTAPADNNVPPPPYGGNGF